MKIVNSNFAPKAVGPYSHAVVSGNLMFLSGQIGVDPVFQKLKDGIDEQTKQIIENIIAVLKEENLKLSNIVKVEIFLTNINDFTIVNEIYSQYFLETKPARVTVECSNLPKGAVVEISCVAEV